MKVKCLGFIISVEDCEKFINTNTIPNYIGFCYQRYFSLYSQIIDDKCC